MNALLFAAAMAAGASDTPHDYTHVLPLTVSGKHSVVQLQLPRDAYLHARSALLNDVRVFDAQGKPQPYALRQAESETGTSHRSLPVRSFPLMGARADAPLAGLEVSTATDGRVLSVRLPEARSAGAAPQPTLAALVFDLRQDGAPEAPLVDALRFKLPAGRSTYNAQVWLEASDDLKHWETVGTAELSWLENASAETLANDKLDFAPRRMRYARLSWRAGEPLQFAAVTAETPVRGGSVAATESLVLPAQPGREATDLQYVRPVGITPSRAGLQLDSGNVVLPATLGAYRQQRKGGRYRFEPAVRTTFYRLEQDGTPRVSGEITVPPWLGEQLVLRFEQPPAPPPALRISWQPATLVFVAGGTPPYTLAVGRDSAQSAARALSDVAPGFTAAELKALEQASAGPARAQPAAMAVAAEHARAAGSGAARRMALLWGVLLLGVAAVGLMVWRLMRQPNGAG